MGEKISTTETKEAIIAGLNKDLDELLDYMANTEFTENSVIFENDGVSLVAHEDWGKKWARIARPALSLEIDKPENVEVQFNLFTKLILFCLKERDKAKPGEKDKVADFYRYLTYSNMAVSALRGFQAYLESFIKSDPGLEVLAKGKEEDDEEEDDEEEDDE